jgi:hypothetical protein
MNLLNIKKITTITIILIISIFSLAADDSVNILATNAWTAAFVEMAGGGVDQLAPSSMEHPPEYELKPSDVKKVRDADILVFAGYEVLMKTVFESFNKPEEQMVKIMTSYSPVMLEKSVMAIAEKLGTVPEARRNIADYKTAISGARAALKAAGLYGVPVLVQFHQKPLAMALGFEILGVFGPQPLEVRQIAELGKTEPVLIIDNAHNPMAAPLEEILGIKAVELVNFPGFLNEDGTTTPATLPGVMKSNVNKLLLK